MKNLWPYGAKHKGDGVWNLYQISWGQDKDCGMFDGCFSIFQFLEKEHGCGEWSVHFIDESSKNEQTAEMVNPFKKDGIKLVPQIYEDHKLFYFEQLEEKDK